MGRRKKVIENVSVIDIGAKGVCIGRSEDGEILAITRGVVPGDVCDVLVTRKKKGMKHGVPLSTRTLSPYRTDPFCSHFGTCGGCKWQNLAYLQQVALKEKMVKDITQRITKDNPEKVKPILPCKHEVRYRNKLEYTFSTKRWYSRHEIDSGVKFNDQRALGFHAPGTFDKVIDVSSCHLQDSLSNDIRNYVRELANTLDVEYYDIKENKGFLRNLVIRNSTLDHWMVTLVIGYFDQTLIDSIFSSMISQFPSVTSWNYIVNDKKNSSLSGLDAVNVSGSPRISEQLGEYIFSISPQSFFQTNSFQAKVLYDTVVEMAELSSEDTVYDLYSGTGSIGIYLSSFCNRVIGIEQVEEAIVDARENARLNRVNNISFLPGDVRLLLNPELIKEYGSIDVLITDPPRAGMHHDVLKTILDAGPRRIVYISCNPATQGRDIQILKEKYELKAVIPVDMFPHTSHVESVASLDKISIQ